MFSSKTDESDSLCFLRFPSAPRFLPWDQRGRGCGLEADKPRQREHARWVYLINLSVTPSYAVTVVYLLVLLQETKPGDTRSCGPPESPHREALPRKDTPLLTAPQPAPHRPPLQTMAGTGNPGVYTPLPLPPRGGELQPRFALIWGRGGGVEIRTSARGHRLSRRRTWRPPNGPAEGGKGTREGRADPA